jgi:hypothetical protein
MKRISFILFLIFTTFILPQSDVNIVEYLKDIENSRGEEVKEKLPELKKKNPGAPSLLYLEGILTEDADDAIKLYSMLADKFPRSAYADAALYRLYSYYSAVNNSNQSDKYAGRLRNEYSSSPYTKLLPVIVKKETVEKEEISYTIQAGAFSTFNNAENLRRKFEKDGHFAAVQDKMVGGTLFKVVFAGKFKSVAEAEKFQLVLNKRYGIKGIIIKLPK